MKGRAHIFFAAVLCCCFPACQPPEPAEQGLWPQGRLVDLTHDFDSTTIYWPTEAGFMLMQGPKGYQDGGYYYEANSFQSAEHGGTHLDAPVHFSEGQWSVEQIPVERLIGASVVVDVSERALQNRDYQVSVEDFAQWEAENGKLPDGVIVLIKTGYGQYWPDREKYMGTARMGSEAVAELHFPGLHPDAAHWLITERSIDAIGLDTPSIDYGQSSLFEAHQILFSDNIPVFENVANLDSLPVYEFSVVALPMKIKGASGGPLRIVAILP